MKQLIELAEQVVEQNYLLINLLTKLSGEDFNHYYPIVSKAIDANNELVKQLLTPQS